MSENNFGRRLRELREKAGWTQPELAERSKVPKGTIANLEQSRSKPSWETVLSLCEALGVKCDTFTEEASSETEPQGRGRPKKDAPEEPAEAEPKKPRGRPKKVKE